MKRTPAHIISRTALFLEYGIAVILLLALLAEAMLLAVNLITSLSRGLSALNLSQMLCDTLTLVIGIEFVKMLVKHTPDSVVEVLLFTIARGMVITHGSALDTLLGVISVGVIFLIRKYLSSGRPELPPASAPDIR